MGLNATEAVERFQDMEELLERLLVRFREGQADFVTRVKGHLERGEAQEALRAAHSLKGVAGSLALDSIAQAASALEKALRGGGTPGPLLEALHLTLEATLVSLRQIPFDFVAMPATETPVPLSQPQVIAQLESLLSRLALHEVDAADHAARLVRSLDALGHPVEAATLQELMKRQAFERAAVLVAKLISSLR